MRVLRLVLLLAIAAPLQAQSADLDPDTLIGMDEEVRGHWVRAVEAFARARGKKPTTRQRARLRHARKRGTAYWSWLLSDLIKAKRYEELPMAIALARLVNPRDAATSRAARIAKSKGLDIPTVPPEDQHSVKEYPYRSPGGRMRSWTPDLRQAEAVIDKALAWLVKQQSPKGQWDARRHGASAAYDVGVTGLALLALTARGPEGLSGARGKAASKAAAYLVGAQSDDGDFGGRSDKAIYMTAFATEALAEYAVIANKRKELLATLERARDYLVDAQAPGQGWRYDKRAVPSDTAVTGRVVCALERLRRAGVAVPEGAFQGAARWTESMTDHEFGQVGYNMRGGSVPRPPGLQATFPSEHSQSMTAAGCLINLYVGRASRDVEKGLRLIREIKPRADFPDMYYWEGGARAWQAARGYVMHNWYAELVSSVVKCLGTDGGVLAKGPWRDGGRVYATAMCVLALSTPYREPPATRASAFFRTKKHVVDVWWETPTGIYLDAGASVKVAASGVLVVWRNGPELGPEGTQDPPKGLAPLHQAGQLRLPGGSHRARRQAVPDQGWRPACAGARPALPAGQRHPSEILRQGLGGLPGACDEVMGGPGGPTLPGGPKLGRYGPFPPADHELMRGFLEGGCFVFSGPSRWNALGLGSTAVFASQLVYNTKRSGVFRFGKPRTS